MAQDFIEKAVDRTLTALGRSVSPEKQNSLVQFIKFGIIGVSNTVIAYLLNAATLLALKPCNVSWDYIAGNIVSFVLSVLWSFYWNNKYVFTAGENEERSTFRTLMKTYVSYGFTAIVLNNILSYIWIEKLGIPKLIAPVPNLLLSVPLNFIINKFWAFSTKKK